MKKKIGIILIILVKIGCCYLGFHTREQKAIKVTQIQTKQEESLSYLLETDKGNLIMIDGGSEADSEHLEELLLSKGGKVKAWYITVAHSQNFGALQSIIENGNIEIENIFMSFGSGEWYQEYEPDRYQAIDEFLSVVNEKGQAIAGVPDRYEVLFDNLYVTVLNVSNEELNGEYAGFNQSMVIKVNNTYKSIIFMGDIADIAAEKFKDNNLDEIDCDAVQISNNDDQFVNDEVYQKMTPKYLFITIPENSDKEHARSYIETLKNKLNCENYYDSALGDVTVTIK